MSPITIALGLPHTPWVPARAESWARLRESLGVAPGPSTVPWPTGVIVASFTERESNRVWPSRMWRWGVDSGLTHFLTIQDDVLVAPCFWPALRAMLEAYPDRIIGLSAVHPVGPEVARKGQRWYCTRSWLVGWAYVLPRADLAAFVAWTEANPARVESTNEDSLLNEWITESGRDTWHPVPTLVDHDTSIESTYGNDEHTHRRATVTWRGYSEHDLCSPDWWRDGSGILLPLAWQHECWACQRQPVAVKAQNGLGLCKLCVLTFSAWAMGVPLALASPKPPT